MTVGELLAKLEGTTTDDEVVVAGFSEEGGFPYTVEIVDVTWDPTSGKLMIEPAA